MLSKDQRIDMHYLTEAYMGSPEARIAPAVFAGELVIDDKDPEKPWAYLKVDRGIPESAYKAIKEAGIPCTPRIDNPHITFLKADDIEALKKVYGEDKWKAAVKEGNETYNFTIRDMMDVDPDGWDEMDRVWFLRCDSPGLMAKRLALELTPLPTSEDGELQDFHISFAVREALEGADVQEESYPYREMVVQALLS